VPNLMNPLVGCMAPVAFLVFAVCLVLIAFEVIQMFARKELKLHTVTRAEVIRALNDLAPYIGKDVEVLDVVRFLLTDSAVVTEEEGQSNHGSEDSQEKTYQAEEEAVQEQTREFEESNCEGESTNLEAGEDSQEKCEFEESNYEGESTNL